jgi:hypothetical protein
VEHFDRCGAEADIDTLTNKLIRHRVVVIVNLYVVVDVDLQSDAPTGELIAIVAKSPHGWALE